MNFFKKIRFLLKHHLVSPVLRGISLWSTVRVTAEIMMEVGKRRDIGKLSTEFADKNGINVHVLCSHRDVEALILCLSCFYVFSEELATVVVHEDGTFTDRDVAVLKKLFPWVEYIPLADADESLRADGFSEETIGARHRHKLMIKAIDFHHIRSRGRILNVDSDVFILGGMNELWERVRNGDNFIFNRDQHSAYGSAGELLSEVIGRGMEVCSEPFVNTGLIVEPAGAMRREKNILEKYCARIDSFEFKRIHCVEQGYIAYVAQYLGVPGWPLSGHYRIVGSGDADAVNWVMKYDINTNKDAVETLHLCGWDKAGKAFKKVRRELFRAMAFGLRNGAKDGAGESMRVAFYPNSVLDWPNPFWRILRDALAVEAVEIVRMLFTVRGLVLNRNKVDVIHFHYAYPEFRDPWLKRSLPRVWNRSYRVLCRLQSRVFGFKLRIAKKLGYRLMYTVHNLVPHDGPKDLDRANVVSLCRAADAVVLMGDSGRDRVEAEAGSGKIRLVPHFDYSGVYGEKISREEARERLGIESAGLVYLCFGRIMRYKGVEKLIEAFADVTGDALLVIAGDPAGDPGYADELQGMAEGCDRIIFLPKRVPEEEVGALMCAADWVVLPFREVTNSGAVALAKTFHKPVICVGRGNVIDCLVPGEDVIVEEHAHLAAALIKTAREGRPRDVGRRGKGMLSAEEAARRYRKIYEGR